MENTGDAVIGIVERDRLSSVLTAIHRGGQGHNARVIDSSRGDVPSQLRRAGVTETIDLSSNTPSTVVVLIHAPGRTAKTAELLRGTGANAIQVVSRIGAESPRDFRTLPLPATKSRTRRVVIPTEPTSVPTHVDD